LIWSNAVGAIASFANGSTKAARQGKQEAITMSTLSKLALGAMGRLHSKPSKGDATPSIALPAPDKSGGLPPMQAIARRRSMRDFASTELPPAMLASLLWAADGINRDDGGRTAPSAMHAQEIDIYVALPAGAYLYDARANALQLVAGCDVRRVTGYQDFVDEAPLDLVYVADHSRMTLIPVASRESFASAAAGAIAQNVYLFAASSGLATVIRAWIDREAIAGALGLTHDQQVLLSQTVGFPKS
jgi:nitroreductase